MYRPGITQESAETLLTVLNAGLDKVELEASQQKYLITFMSNLSIEAQIAPALEKILTKQVDEISKESWEAIQARIAERSQPTAYNPESDRQEESNRPQE